MNILSMSSFIPEQICDITRFMGYPGNQSISHYCGYAADYIAQVLYDNSIDGAVYPKSCDSSRVITSYTEKSKKFRYQMPVPSRSDEAAIEFLASSIKNYKCALEKHYNIRIKDIEERTELVNKRNISIKNMYNKLSESINYSLYLKNIHNMLLQPLREQKVSIKSAGNLINGKPVYLVGSFLTNLDIIDTIEQSGMKLVGDNLTESKRLFSTPIVSTEGDIYYNIAKSILNSKFSPTQNNFERILEDDLTEIKAKDVKGVIYVTQKYCEPYDYMYSVYKKMLDENGIPVQRLSLANSTDNRHLEFALDAFADII